MYTSNNLYTHLVNGKQVDIFEDAEPYFYGTAAPSTVYFKPLGGADPDYRVQQLAKESSNTFSKIVAADKFVFKGDSGIKSLEYIKKGTFPIISDKYKLREWSNVGSTDAKNVLLTATYDLDTQELTSITIKENWGGGQTKTYSAPNELNINNSHQLTKLPSVLGFILVGGGGHAGGITQYDTNADGKTTNQHAYAGSGGGGGETVWGTIDLSYPNSVIKFKSGLDIGYYDDVYTILGHLLREEFGNYYTTAYAKPKITSMTLRIHISGDNIRGGGHGDWKSCSHKSPKVGENGETGGISMISVDSFTYRLQYEDSDQSVTISADESDRILARAYGGEGGKSPSSSQASSGGTVAGGKGGTGDAKGPDIWSICTVCGREAGGDGAMVGCATGKTSRNAYNLTITLCDDATVISKDTTQDYKLQIERVKKETASGGFGSGSKTEWANTAAIDVPGGQSFGVGATKSTAAGPGGGGACSRNYGDSGENPTGGGGFFAVYY